MIVWFENKRLRFCFKLRRAKQSWNRRLPLSATDLRLNYCGFKPIHCYTIKITSQQISDRRFPTNSFKKRKSKRSKSERVIESSDGSGSKIWFFVARVRSGHSSMVWVWVWKISPKNVKFFYFFSLWAKKISSSRVKKYPGQRRVGLLFTAGQK